MAHIGIDVSKNKLDCMWVRDLEAGKVKPKVFPNRRDQYPELLHWLERNTGEPPEALHVYLEATGIYHEPLAYWLHEHGVRVHLLNPAQVRFHAQGMG
ncbi:transposase, partial [Thioalkalivibrio sp. AKL17]